MAFPNDGLLNNLSAYERQKLVRERFLNNITDSVTASEIAAIIAAEGYLTENSANFLQVIADVAALEASVAANDAQAAIIQQQYADILAEFLLLESLSNGGAKSKTTYTANLPPTGTLGDVYIIPSDDPTNPDTLAIWDNVNQIWIFEAPKNGNVFYVSDENTSYMWDGTSWTSNSNTILADIAMDLVVDATLDRVLTDADFLGNRYITMTNAAANTVTINAGLTTLGPVTISQNGAGSTSFVGGVGVTLISTESKVAMAFQYSAVAVIPIGGDTYQLVGSLA